LRVAIVGCGVVGTATGIGLSQHGHVVDYYDINRTLVDRMAMRGYAATTDLKDAIKSCTAVMVCVPTPASNGTLDTSAVEHVMEKLGAAMDFKRQTAIVRSTVPVNYTATLTKYVPESRLMYNPEFLREKHALDDFLAPDRILIGRGPNSHDGVGVARELYAKFHAPIIETTWEAAEMAKLVANSFLATKISFFNEIAVICQKLRISPRTVSEIVAFDKRIGPYGTEGGRPFDGKCLPKDLDCMISIAKSTGYDPELLSATRTVNQMAEALFLPQPPTPILAIPTRTYQRDKSRQEIHA